MASMALMPGLQRLADRLALGHAGRRSLRPAGVRSSRSAPCRPADCPADRPRGRRPLRRPARESSRPSASNLVTFVDLQVVAQDDHADAVLFQVERQADHAVGELDHFAGHHAGQPVDPGDTVTDFQHRSDFADVDLALELSRFLSE